MKRIAISVILVIPISLVHCMEKPLNYQDQVKNRIKEFPPKKLKECLAIPDAHAALADKVQYQEKLRTQYANGELSIWMKEYDFFKTKAVKKMLRDKARNEPREAISFYYILRNYLTILHELNAPRILTDLVQVQMVCLEQPWWRKIENLFSRYASCICCLFRRMLRSL